MKIEFSDFTPFRIEDRAVFLSFMQKYPSDSSHYNFAALFCWQDQYRTLWQIQGEHLLIFNSLTDILLMPLGPPLDAESLLSISSQLKANNHSGKIGLVPPEFLEAQPAIASSFELLRDDDNADYIYATRNLVELKGRRLSKKRNLIHQFIQEHPGYHCREMNPEEWMICRRLAEEWSLKQLQIPLDQSPESRALSRAFSHCHDLDLHGFGLFLGPHLEAFSIWSRQNDSMATIHFEKFNPSIKGTSQMINRETARVLASWAVRINREQDLGIPGLKRAKMAYEPEHLLWGYTAIPGITGTP